MWLGMSAQTPISVSYLGHFILHPGIKVGTEFELKEWGESGANKVSRLFVSPQLGYYSAGGIQRGVFVNADVGFRRINPDNIRAFYSDLSVGIAYLYQARQISLNVNVGTGEVSDENWEGTSYLMPTVSYAFGRGWSERIGWFAKGTFGGKVLGAKESEIVVMMELGLRIMVGE